MEAFKTLYSKIEAVKLEASKLAVEAVKKNSTSIITYLQTQQLGIGLNSDGEPLHSKNDENINGFYKAVTQNYWAKVHPPVKPKIAGRAYNFQWTGTTFGTMALRIKSDEFEIFTKDGKQRMLEGIYGRIFDLSPENNELINENIILPYIFQGMISKLGKLY